MSQIERIDPPHNGTEAETLAGFLDYHRDTLRIKTEGLDADQLDRHLGPSSMTLGGLLKHLAYVEDWWFNQVFAGSAAPEPWASVDWNADRDWEWHTAARDTPEELRTLFEEAVSTSQRIYAEAAKAPAGLGAEAKMSHRRAPRQKFSLRWILVHMIEEYARHNGHADLIRESIDGLTGE